MKRSLLWTLLAGLAGCGEKDTEGEGAGGDPAGPLDTDSGEEPAGDADGDGYAAEEGDCDDADPASHPGAAEGCDGADNDCDGAIDEDAADAPAWYGDGDGDGYGNAEYSLVQCDQPAGFAALPGDCADEDPMINPGIEEVCGDEIDNNCDAQVDENMLTQYLDIDQDGYGQTAVVVTGCELSPGFSLEGGDCADIDEQRHPGADEICGDEEDNNCDDAIDESCGEEEEGGGEVGEWSSWTGYETLDYGYAAEPGGRNCHLRWETSGTPAADPCPDCEFTFDVSYTYDAASSEDDGTCADLAGDFGPYSYGYDPDYSGVPAIVIGYYGEWYYWFGVDVLEESEGDLIYSYGVEDYYYKGGYYTYWQYGRVALE